VYNVDNLAEAFKQRDHEAHDVFLERLAHVSDLLLGASLAAQPEAVAQAEPIAKNVSNGPQDRLELRAVCLAGAPGNEEDQDLEEAPVCHRFGLKLRRQKRALTFRIERLASAA
jgi:hypothetical protein